MILKENIATYRLSISFVICVYKVYRLDFSFVRIELIFRLSVSNCFSFISIDLIFRLSVSSFFFVYRYRSDFSLIGRMIEISNSFLVRYPSLLIAGTHPSFMLSSSRNKLLIHDFPPPFYASFGSGQSYNTYYCSFSAGPTAAVSMNPFTDRRETLNDKLLLFVHQAVARHRSFRFSVGLHSLSLQGSFLVFFCGGHSHCQMANYAILL